MKDVPLVGAPTELRAVATMLQDSADTLKALACDREMIGDIAKSQAKDLNSHASGLRELANELEADYAR
ncbi:hypothetical protein BH24ACT15_BH24ACT15_29900 [soil metagenome]